MTPASAEKGKRMIRQPPALRHSSASLVASPASVVEGGEPYGSQISVVTWARSGCVRCVRAVQVSATA